MSESPGTADRTPPPISTRKRLRRELTTEGSSAAVIGSVSRVRGPVTESTGGFSRELREPVRSLARLAKCLDQSLHIQLGFAVHTA